jgi:redox-sensitive bicupin YhaK (pirin superfamily)
MIIPSRTVKLTTRTGIDIQRTLPHRYIRTIGAWCFIDHFGPTEQENAMSVAAHPHVGLQTVSWLFAGEVEHRDSLGSIQTIHPGELNLMTAGHGIAHSELSSTNAGQMHGVQLWTVLPEGARDGAAHFDHYNELPIFEISGMQVRLFIGELLGYSSPARTFSEMVGAELDIPAGCSIEIPIDSSFEYGLLVVAGELHVKDEVVALENLYYQVAGEPTLHISSTLGAKLVLLGGVPFGEEILMWWNFIGRTHEEIEEMRRDWGNQSSRFASFEDQIHGRIPAPTMPNLRLTLRGNVSPD